MNFSQLDLLAPEIIIQDVLQNIDDEDKKQFADGYYISLVEQGLTDIEYSTFINRMFNDFEFPKDTMRLPIPKGAFNVIDVFLMNKDSNGTIQATRNVFVKNNGYSLGYQKGETSRMKDGTFDIIYRSPLNYSSICSCNINNGYLTFNDSCADFGWVRVVYNGVSTDIGVTPLIPRIFRQYLIDYVTVRCLKILIGRNPNKYMNPLKVHSASLNTPYEGTLAIAKKNIRNLDTKYLKDMKEYLAKMQP